MQDFLLELGFEELPARFIDKAAQEIKEKIAQGLADQRLASGPMAVFSTPRRLTLFIENLSSRQEDIIQEIKGPPKAIAYDEQGVLTKAGSGFLRSQKASPAHLLIKKFQGADYLYVQKEVLGQGATEILKPLLEKVITTLSFPKNMRWEASGLRYARPLRWIIALFGTEVIPLQIGKVHADRSTWGHRQLSPGPIDIFEPRGYEAVLKEHFVIADAGKRQHMIWEQIKALAAAKKAQVQEDGELLGEITNLVEYPTAFCGSFATEYLSIPAPVLITAMKEQQRYFPLRDEKGQLLPKFIGVRNGADNHLEKVVRGNEKVLAARLADAKFFYEEDLRIPLEDNLKQLERAVFQKGLGSMDGKVKRIVRLSGILAEKLGYQEQKANILRTAQLAKADLASQMVGEFPNLQGVMGEKYARFQGEPSSVAQGVREHYQPRFAKDALPSTVEGTIVSVADKSDTLAGHFALGQIPTGSQDPFALRRQAQGVVHILAEKQLPLSLRELIDLAAAGYEGLPFAAQKKAALQEFLQARIRFHLLGQGYPYYLVDTVLAAADDHVPNVVAKVTALAALEKAAHFEDLLVGFERMANLAQKAKSGQLAVDAFHPCDQVFQAAMDLLQQNCRRKYDERRYSEVLKNLAGFRKAVDQFFEEALIMDEDPTVRQNRLLLLKHAMEVYELYGDFRQIVVNR